MATTYLHVKQPVRTFLLPLRPEGFEDTVAGIWKDMARNWALAEVTWSTTGHGGLYH